MDQGCNSQLAPKSIFWAAFCLLPESQLWAFKSLSLVRFFWGEKKRVLAIVILSIIVFQIGKENGLCGVILIIVLLSWRIMAEPFKLSSFLLYRKEDLKPISASELSRRLNPSAEEFAPWHAGHAQPLPQGSHCQRNGCRGGFPAITQVWPMIPWFYDSIPTGTSIFVLVFIAWLKSKTSDSYYIFFLLKLLYFLKVKNGQTSPCLYNLLHWELMCILIKTWRKSPLWGKRGTEPSNEPEPTLCTTL